MSDNSRDYEFDPELLSIRKFVRRADGTMGLEFDQFDGESASAASGCLPSLVGTAATNWLLVSAVTGKTLHTRYVYLASPKKTTVRFHNGNTTTTKLAIRCASAASFTVNLSGCCGPVFTSAIYVSVTSAATAATVTLGGVRDPDAPSS